MVVFIVNGFPDFLQLSMPTGGKHGRRRSDEPKEPVPPRMNSDTGSLESLLAGVFGGTVMTQNDRPLTVSLFGATLPLPRWALGWIGVIVLAGVGGLVVRNVWPATPELVSLKAANAQMELAVREYGRHMAETPTTTYADADGVFTIKTFADHCVVIARRIAGGGLLTKLVPDLTLDPQKMASRVSLKAFDTKSWPVAILDGIAPRLEAQGRCVNPHSGPFNSWYGARNGCLVQVWRQWQDGCTHYQMLNSCNGYWDTNPNGSPRLSWTACRH
jgi:hypothetical protein